MALPLIFLTIFLSSLLLISDATVPPSRRFRHVNNGDFGEYFVEYSADYRLVPGLTRYPFTLCFYNSTPDAFILGLRFGHHRSESVMRWVWDANRDHPVHENATLTLAADGNLVLTDSDGSVAWETGTAGKGVSGLDILENGNLVLYDREGRYIWQSFDHPTDTLLVGQSLQIRPGPTKLTSRKSASEPVNGPYSLVMEKRSWAMYYSEMAQKPAKIYYRSSEFGNGRGALAHLELYCAPEYGSNYAFELGFRYNMTGSNSFGTRYLSLPKHNATYSMLRVDVDGNLRIYTYNTNVDSQAWDVTYALFEKGPDGRASECKLPRRCGSLGVCEEDQCVACPTPRGLLGWNKGCASPVLPPCKGGKSVDYYYKVEGVEHYSSEYNDGIGGLSLRRCRDKCTKDCSCLGFFYKPESSKCLVVSELGTLVRVSNVSHVGFIKMASK